MSLSLLEPSWLDPWMRHPAFLYPIGFGLLMLLCIAFLQFRDLPSRRRARGKSTLDPGQLEELMLGTPPAILDLRSEEAYRGSTAISAMRSISPSPSSSSASMNSIPAIRAPSYWWTRMMCSPTRLFPWWRPGATPGFMC